MKRSSSDYIGLTTMSRPSSIVKTKFQEDVESTVDVRSNVTASEENLNATKNAAIDEHYNLTWRSYLVVIVTCFAQMAQVFVIVGSGQIMAFISRDLGDAELAGWIIQAPLLMQSVLSPIVGRLSDILDRKWLISIPPLIAFAGAVVSATANTMSTLIGGGILIGVTLSTISILQAIPSEVLPLKYRAVANGAGFLGSAVGGIVGSLGAGAVTTISPSGWRYVFWIQAALHGATCISLILLYHPPRRSDYPRLDLKGYLWAIDPVGSGFFMIGTTLTLLALDWASVYSWSSARVVAPLCIGLVMLVAFFLYEWKGRDDGILAHAFFRKSPNFVLANFTFLVEGWIFYSAINSVIPQIILNLGFEDNAWSISVRQLSSSVTTIGACVAIIVYATKFKDMKTPLLVSFGVCLAATICFSLITPNMSSAQIGYNVLIGVGQAGPLTLLVAIIQLSAPHEYLSTVTGLAFSVRAVGGAFGSAVLSAIINGKLNASYAKDVGAAAMDAGLPQSSVADLIEGLLSGKVAGLDELPGSNESIVASAVDASRWAYAHAYRIAWNSIIPFVVLAMVAVFFMKQVKEQMTEEIEASVEPLVRRREKESV